MKLTFLGTSGAVPTTERNTAGLMIAREGERLLFDCGEGTQRQMMHYGTGFDLDYIFLTHLHGDHVFGLPGLLQTLDFNDRERPLTIYTPEGTHTRIEDLISSTGEPPSFPIRLTDVTAGETILTRPDYEVRTFPVDHRTTSVGYALLEDERKGRFDREYAEAELGIPPGPKYATLHAGEPVEHEGRTIEPDEVVGPPRPGRHVVYTGDTRPTETTVAAATDADVLVHDGCFADEHVERARETAHSTAREAAEIAQEAGVRQLYLTHISTRYAGGDDHLEAEAREVFPAASVARDGMQVDVPFPDSDEEFTVEYR